LLSLFARTHQQNRSNDNEVVFLGSHHALLWLHQVGELKRQLTPPVHARAARATAEAVFQHLKADDSPFATVSTTTKSVSTILPSA